MKRNWLNWTAMTAVSAVLALGAIVPASAGQRDNNGDSTHQQRDYNQGDSGHRVRSPQVDRSRRHGNNNNRWNRNENARSHRRDGQFRSQGRRNYRAGDHSSATMRSNHGGNWQHTQQHDRSNTGGNQH